MVRSQPRPEPAAVICSRRTWNSRHPVKSSLSVWVKVSPAVIATVSVLPLFCPRNHSANPPAASLRTRWKSALPPPGPTGQIDKAGLERNAVAGPAGPVADESASRTRELPGGTSISAQVCPLTSRVGAVTLRPSRVTVQPRQRFGTYASIWAAGAALSTVRV